MHYNVLWGFFLLIYFLPLLMTFTPLALPLSFLLLLIIMFISWFLWGLWSNLARVRLHWFWFTFQLLFSCWFLLPFRRYQGFRHIVWICFFYFFFFAKCVGQKKFHVDVFSKLWDVQIAFWIFFSMFHLETFLFVQFLPFLHQSFNISLLLLT